jgi:phage terminase large subunit
MNPFLDPSQVKEIERLKQVDLELYEVYTLGNWVKLTGLIYSKFTMVPNIPDGKRVYGLDFGFSNDPTALIEIVKIDKNLYFKELLYEKELLTKEVIDFMHGNVKRTDMIIADSADPKAIEEIRRAGFRIRASKKGADSIRKGIDTVKQYNLFVTEDSMNLQTEFRRYKWKKDREDKTLNVPIDSYNHLMDALRYGTEYISRKNRFQVIG